MRSSSSSATLRSMLINFSPSATRRQHIAGNLGIEAARMSCRIPARRKTRVAGVPYWLARRRVSRPGQASRTRVGMRCCARRMARRRPEGPAPAIMSSEGVRWRIEVLNVWLGLTLSNGGLVLLVAILASMDIYREEEKDRTFSRDI